MTMQSICSVLLVSSEIETSCVSFDRKGSDNQLYGGVRKNQVIDFL